MKKIGQALIALTVLSGYVNSRGLEFNDKAKPINPACIALFNHSEADLPYIRAVNITRCQNSNAAFQTLHKSDNGMYFYFANDKDDSEGSYGYRYIGHSVNGVDVLQTESSGGGTLVASDLLLVRLTKTTQPVYDGAKMSVNPIQVITLLGYITGGDRCMGSIRKAEISGNTLIVEQYAGSNPSDCQKQMTHRIDLSNL